MAHETKTTSKSLKLPVSVASPVDIGRLLKELQAIDEAMLQLKLRKGGKPASIPHTSQLLDRTVELNKLNLLQEADRKQLSDFLGAVKDKAPVLHMSFSADPSVGFIEKLMTWLRREIHPQVLLSIGLQPNIGAGCMVRSTNKYFDFTLRHKFESKREVLLEKLATAKVKA